jgi:hypothetical protein
MEWQIFKQATSPDLRSQLSIPLRSGFLIRPFLCVTKKQIRKLAKVCSIPYLEDSSNKKCDFQRNWLRKNIVQPLCKKFPHSEQFFTLRQQALYIQLKPPMLHDKTQKWEHLHLFMLYQNPKTLTSAQTLALKDKFRKSIQELSPLERGRLHRQIEVLLKSYIQGKHGPISFSNGVKAYIIGPKIIFTTKDKVFCSQETVIEVTPEDFHKISTLYVKHTKKKKRSAIHHGFLEIDVWANEANLLDSEKFYGLNTKLFGQECVENSPDR